MLDLIASYLVRGLNRFLNAMPMGFNLALGRGLGSFFYFLSGKRRRITYSNLKAAFSGEKSPSEIKRITRNVYLNFAETFAEILSMTKFDKDYIFKHVDVVDLERIHEAGKNPRGMILISAHFGNWELSTVTSVMHGFPLYLLARDQKMEKLNELLNLLRESRGNIVVRKGLDIKNIFRILHEGKSLGILADQNAGTGGELIDFFGRPASTATGPYRFAQKSGAWILPAFIHREKGPDHKLFLEEPMMIGRNDDILPYMKKYSELLEKHVRNNPDQWLWMHKRWKMTPVKTVMVLDDGKKGHLKQSLAVLKQIRKYRQDEGYAPEHLKAEIVPINFKNKFRRTALAALSPFFGPYLQGRPFLLEWALGERCYEKAVNTYADVVLSTGSALFAVNRLLKIENWAKNITVLDPGRFARKAFDLVVIPRHDAGDAFGEDKKVIVTELAPNLIDEEALKTFETSSGRCVGVLVGGDNPDFSFTDSQAASLAGSVKSSAEALGGCYSITTSRRTSESAERILKDSVAGDGSCRRFISGRDDSDEHTVEKILASSDVVVTSGESISMVSEAVSSGRPVVVFMPERRKEGITKYERFVKGLAEKGYVSLSRVDNIADEVEKAVKKPSRKELPDDDKRIYEKLYKLF